MFRNISRDTESRKGKAAVCEPLNLSVETTNKNKSPSNSTVQENGDIPMLVDSSDNDSHHVSKLTEAEGDQIESIPPKSTSLKIKLKSVANQEKRVKFSEDLNLPALAENESKKDCNPIWFSLVASKEQ